MEWFSRTTSIGGTAIPNWVLVVGAPIVIWLRSTIHCLTGAAEPHSKWGNH